MKRVKSRGDNWVASGQVNQNYSING